MGKKRKAGGRHFQAKDSARGEPQVSDSKIRVDAFEDVADSEDEFSNGQDKLFLEEGPVQKRQRRTRENGTMRTLTLERASIFILKLMSG